MFGIIGTKNHPLGPDFAKAREESYDLSGTRLSFKAPEHDYIRAPREEPRREFNLYEEGLYRTEDDYPWRLEGFGVDSIGWSFFGLPLLQGRLADLFMHCSVIRRREGESLFNAADFEATVDNDLYDFCVIEDKTDLYRCPLNWELRELNGCLWVYFDVEQVKSQFSHDVGLDKKMLRLIGNWVTPLTDDHMLLIAFQRARFSLAPGVDRAMVRLMERIMATCTLELSPDAQAQKQRAEARWPNNAYSPRREPLDFAAYEEAHDYGVMRLMEKERGSEEPLSYEELIRRYESSPRYEFDEIKKP